MTWRIEQLAEECSISSGPSGLMTVPRKSVRKIATLLSAGSSPRAHTLCIDDSVSYGYDIRNDGPAEASVRLPRLHLSATKRRERGLPSTPTPVCWNRLICGNAKFRRFRLKRYGTRALLRPRSFFKSPLGDCGPWLCSIFQRDSFETLQDPHSIGFATFGCYPAGAQHLNPCDRC